MQERFLLEKISIATIGAWISNKFGMLCPVLELLIILMLVDYISGLLAARKEALENPENREYGLSSKKSILGIYKKFGYILTIFVAISIDYLISKFSKEIGVTIESNTIFGLLVSIWFIINELISILENAGRMGVALPQFLNRILAELKKEIDEKK